MDWSDRSSRGFDLVAAEFVVATAEYADVPAYQPLCSMLRRVRSAFGMDVAFVSEWAAGRTVVRRVSSSPQRQYARVELQGTYGRRLLDDTAQPQADFGESVHFDAVPVVTSDGLEHGTLCCRQIIAQGTESDSSRLEAVDAVAQLMADWFQDADLSLSSLMPLRGDTVMGGLSHQA
ncbi:MAG TPA: hypothetical protein VIE63_02865 [Ramlibacter sp.]